MWDDGNGIINGIGYPNPNLSHFKSFDYWHSAEPNGVPKDGWMDAIWIINAMDVVATTGIVNRRPTFAFKSDAATSPSVTFQNPQFFNWRDKEILGQEKSRRTLSKHIGLDHETDDGVVKRMILSLTSSVPLTRHD